MNAKPLFDRPDAHYPWATWEDTNPSFSASLDGTWLVEIGPVGPAFRREDRLCAIVRDGTVTGGGKFFTWRGQITPKVDAEGATWGFTGTLDVKRIAMPHYQNAWTEWTTEFQLPLNFELINPQYATGEFVRDGVGPLASYWHKLLA
jgi:hypothetical protein